MSETRLHSTWLTSDRFIPSRFVRPVLRFTEVEAASGVVLLIAAAAALLWANLGGTSYEAFWQTEIDVSVGPLHLTETLRDIVNDGFMAVFFFVVGLEIKRELVVGDLRDPRAAALPALAALGGMVVPAAFYLLIVGGGEAARGWGIPMATDIAFSVGVIALLATRVPVGAKLFLLALAIVDDIGAITVIAVFYTDELAIGWLIAAIVLLGAILVAQRVNIRALPFYVPVGFAVWFAMLESGVHATLAGVALGMLTPSRPYYDAGEFDRRARRILDTYPVDDRSARAQEHVDHEALTLATVASESVAPLGRLEEKLHPWSSFLVIPIFALANAGVVLTGIDLVDALLHPVALGVAVGLVAGKTLGIGAFTWLAVRTGWGKLPPGANARHMIGVAMLAGIGFTVSLFVASLAFTDPVVGDRAKIGIFAGSLIAGLGGYVLLRFSSPRGSP